MPRAKGDSNKPRGRMTAYAYFMQTCREEHKNKYPDENVVFLEFSRRCAGQWKLMTENDKKRFQGMAERDKLRFENEMRHYQPPQGATGRGTKRKQVKDPNAPKRSLSAFFWFCHDLRGHVKEQHPEYTLGEIAKELGRRWGVSDDATKAQYAAKAEQDRARYERDMNAYKKSKLEPHSEYYDEDEEEDDDE
ncbi:high mobility group protein DSP1-like [Daphnia pulex]|uniref:high mobility group protein DSP1-like n=1 Tax=Daphnia pulex TaxID=6669 RepID=UPI001EDD0A6D|nr:high mobility group protein DSP1-like [Daphnia pulex]XP_046462879.1 high mobility group protein DSP1-like [Daphnia pulex]